MTTSQSAEDVAPPVQQLQLENGLQFVWQEDHRQPLVALEARIKGGLRQEGPFLGTGITHFIEHMLFKGTPTRPPGTIDQEIRRYGGSINAFTSFDSTGVTLFVDSKYMKEALGLLADVLQHAVFDPVEFEKERTVIVSEIQMNLDDPGRRLHRLFWGRHLLEHPYRHPILGYQPLLERLSVQELTSFYTMQYQPQNVTISCVGDLDPAAFGALAKDMFAAWPRGTPDPRFEVVAQEPPVASAKTATIEMPVQNAYVMLGFTSTRLSDPDLYALDVLASILGDGESSRLYEVVVRQQQLASSISAWNYTPYDRGVLGVSFRADPEQVEPAIEAAWRQIALLQEQGVAETELEKAKRKATAEYIFGLQTIEARAYDLANSMMLTGDPLFSRRYLDGIKRVTRQQVQEVARRYCQRSAMTTAVIRPQAQAAESVKPSPAQQVAVEAVDLPNGARALIGVDKTLPMAAIVVGFRGGVRVEEETRQGLSHLVAELLTKGTKRRTAQDIARTVESLGGQLEPFSGRDGFGLTLQVLQEDLDQGLALMHELVTESTYPQEEIGIQQQIIQQQLRAQNDDIFEVGGKLLRKTFFQEHPYRFNPLGTEESVASMTREHCLGFAKHWLVARNMVVTVFGDVDRQAVAKQVRATFGKVAEGDAPWPDRLAAQPPTDVRTASETMEERAQTLIMFGFPGTTHRSEDRYAVDVLTTVLSGMSGRLFQAVREAHGLSYTLGAVHVPGWDPGYLVVYAATKPEEEARVLQLLNEQLALAREQGFNDQEVDEAKRYLIGQQRMEVQHLSGLAKRSTIDELYGVGYAAWKEYEARVNAVTPQMVQDAASRYLTVGHHAVVVVSPERQPQATARQ